MKYILIKASVILASFTLLTGICFASSHNTYVAPQKIYILRITSQNKDIPMHFSGSYMIASNSGSKIANIEQMTPFEVTVKANFLGGMFIARDSGPDINVEVLERDSDGQHFRLSGTGSAEFAHIDTDGMAYITGR